jgi:hypothetical protein
MRIHSDQHGGFRHWIMAASLLVFGVDLSGAEPLVPGTGTLFSEVGDDFEDEGWEYIYNNPKSTYDNDKEQRYPAGGSKNGRWYEGMKRGQPDVIKRVPTPKGGLPGSRGSLLLRSLYTGIPGRPSYQMQQDDFIADVSSRVGGAIPVSRSPSVVVRVFLPPVATWEKRTGPHFAFRADVETTVLKESGNTRFSSTHRESETYWPGLFVAFESQADGRDNNYAYFSLRSDERGHDFRGPQIATTGWWTLGMSFTPNGMVHYFAKPGVEDLTPKDHIASQYPYGYRCERFETFFFDVLNSDDGHTWSTSFVIDDPHVYCLR